MWMQRHDTMLFPSTGLQESGYTYDYFSPALLRHMEQIVPDIAQGAKQLFLLHRAIPSFSRQARSLPRVRWRVDLTLPSAMP